MGQYLDARNGASFGNSLGTVSPAALNLALKTPVAPPPCVATPYLPLTREEWCSLTHARRQVQEQAALKVHQQFKTTTAGLDDALPLKAAALKYGKRLAMAGLGLGWPTTQQIQICALFLLTKHYGAETARQTMAATSKPKVWGAPQPAATYQHAGDDRMPAPQPAVVYQHAGDDRMPAKKAPAPADTMRSFEDMRRSLSPTGSDPVKDAAATKSAVLSALVKASNDAVGLPGFEVQGTPTVKQVPNTGAVTGEMVSLVPADTGMVLPPPAETPVRIDPTTGLVTPTNTPGAPGPLPMPIDVQAPARTHNWLWMAGAGLVLLLVLRR